MERSALGGDFTGAREGFEGGIGGLLDHPRFIHGMEREREAGALESRGRRWGMSTYKCLEPLVLHLNCG